MRQNRPIEVTLPPKSSKQQKYDSSPPESRLPSKRIISQEKNTASVSNNSIIGDSAPRVGDSKDRSGQKGRALLYKLSWVDGTLLGPLNGKKGSLDPVVVIV